MRSTLVPALGDAARRSSAVTAPDPSGAPATSCRFCGAPLEHVFADLGTSPLANSYLPPERADAMEPFYPLRALVCDHCFLVQLEEFETPEQIFSDYAYFSSYSVSWLEHCRALRRADDRALRPRRRTATSSRSPPTTATCCSTSTSAGSRVLGIEPAANVAEVALRKGIPTLVEFFGRARRARRSRRSPRADLLLGNNVLAHVPDLNDFVARHEDPARARRHDHDGVPAPDAADRGPPVGHHLPRALLLLLAS